MDIQDTIHALIEKHVAQTPLNIAALCEGQTLTYTALNESANQLAQHLREIGVKPDTQVAICMERSIHLLSVILAILKAGGTYVPLDPLHPEARLLFTLTDNNNPIIIINSKFKDKFMHYQGTLLVLEEDEHKIAAQPTHNLNPVVSPQHLAYIIYTSGSTGKPKGALIEHRSVVNYCRWFADYCCDRPQKTIDFSSNYIFDMAVTTSIIPLMLGLTVVICKDDVKKDVRDYLKYLAKNKISIIKMTPSYFKVLLHEVKNNPFALPYLESIILGGENLPAADCASWLSLYPHHTLFNEYGPTEATVAVSQYKICKNNLASLELNVPIGQSGPNMECYILDSDNAPVIDGEVGELHIGGVCLSRGYLNQPELTAKQFIQHSFNHRHKTRLYKTGDLCRRRPDGMIEYIGRIDNQVKIRGFRVEPGEIERCIVAHPAVKDVVVLAQKDEQHEKLIAYYILDNDNVAPNVTQIQPYLAANLPDYMIPTAFVRIDAFPLTANGKLDRLALPIPRFTTNQHYLAPCTALEKTLAEIWSEELGLKLIGTEDNFFELGGHSLSAARIISKINSTLSKEISLREFYEASTIKKLITIIYRANKIDKKIWIPSSNTASYDEPLYLPLSDFQLMLWLSSTFEPRAKKMNITARKRLQGRLDQQALTFAFNAVFKKHEILFYRILTFRPAQRLQENLPFTIIERHLESLTELESKSALDVSMDELIHHYPWKKGMPLVMARLFHLKNEEVELQICMPHIIADEASPDILFADLSQFYHRYNDQPILDNVIANKCYRDYQSNEQHYSQERINSDIAFWEEYLKEASLFAFQPEHIVKNMASANYSYSTYIEMPEKSATKIQQFCAENCISINDGLCAVLGLALVNCSHHFNDETQPIFMNIVKSTRGNPVYDDTIGCFLKLEPIKLGLSKRADLISLSKQIHQSTIDTAPYQQCSALVKLASINTLRRKRSHIKKYLFETLIYLYTKICSMPNLDRKTLNLCERLVAFKRTNQFVVNINVHKSFIPGVKLQNTTELFGLKTKKNQSHQHDLLEIDQFLDVCFLRDDDKDTPFIVISANLTPSYREQIAREMIRIINSETNGHITEKTPRFERSVQVQRQSDLSAIKEMAN